MNRRNRFQPSFQSVNCSLLFLLECLCGVFRLRARLSSFGLTLFPLIFCRGGQQQFTSVPPLNHRTRTYKCNSLQQLVAHPDDLIPTSYVGAFASRIGEAFILESPAAPLAKRLLVRIFSALFFVRHQVPLHLHQTVPQANQRENPKPGENQATGTSHPTAAIQPSSLSRTLLLINKGCHFEGKPINCCRGD